MDWKSFLPAVVGGLIVALGWVVSHYLNKSRDIAAEKRKLRVTYLLEAYRKLEYAGNRAIDVDSAHARDIESAFADIQLLGTPAQVTLSQEMVKRFAEDGTVLFDPILQSLRQSLRKELELEPVDNKLIFFRIGKSRRGVNGPSRR